MRRCQHHIASMGILTLLVAAGISMAGSRQGDLSNDNKKPFAIVSIDNGLYSVAPHSDAAMTHDKLPRKYSMVHVAIFEPGRIVLSTFTSDVKTYPEWAIDGTKLYWSWAHELSPGQVNRDVFAIELPNKQGHIEIAPLLNQYIAKLKPVNDAMLLAEVRGERQPHYDLINNDGTIEVWIDNGTVLNRWKLAKEKKGWVGAGEYRFGVHLHFIVVPAAVPLVVTSQGDIYKVADTAVTLIAKISMPESVNRGSSQPSTRREASGATTSMPASAPSTQLADASLNQPRLVLLDIRKDGKYALFLWNNNELKALDIVDDKKQNIEPFVAADAVDKDVTKAVKTMMTTVVEGEKKIAIVEAAEHERQAEKASTQPVRQKTLQEHLED